MMDERLLETWTDGREKGELEREKRKPGSDGGIRQSYGGRALCAPKRDRPLRVCERAPATQGPPWGPR